MRGGIALTGQDDRTPPIKPGLAMTPRASSWAWGLCWLMFASTVLNYMCRQTVSLVKPEIKGTFGIPNDQEFGWVLSAFYMTYALFQWPAGYLIDRWDLRRSYAAAVAWWSTAAVATAIVPTLGLLIASRALLGVGESFNWPCGLRVTSRILPPQDRTLGNGIFNSGAAVGAVATPLIIAWLAPLFGWQVAFLVIGGAGYVWVAAWLFLVRGEPARLLARPEPEYVEHAAPGSGSGRLSPTARVAFAAVVIAATAVAASAWWFGPSAIWLGITVGMLGPAALAGLLPREYLSARGWAGSLADVVRLRRFWIMFVVSISINICWHFLVNWIPSYLKDERHLSDVIGNYLTAVTMLAADMGNLGGGWLSRRLAASGLSVVTARKCVIGLCMLLILVGPFVSLPQSVPAAMILLSIMAAGTAAFMANFFSFCQEVSPRHTGLVIGYLGGMGNLFVAGYHPLAGMLKDLTGSYAANFSIVALAPLAGTAAILWGWNDRKLEAEEGNGEQGKGKGRS